MKDQRIWRKAAGALLVTCLMLGSLALPCMAQEDQPQPLPEVKLKSENTALLLSLFGTLVPYGLVALSPQDRGLVVTCLAAGLVGPSVGYVYGGMARRGLAAILTRLAGAGGLLGGFALLWGEGSGEFGIGLMIVGGCTVIASTLGDIAGVKRAVREHNRKVQGLSLNVAPILVPKSKTVGLSLQLGF